ncbi:DUF397 domain-containing protein [Bailinhaonella thermotolerans]|uniref:DUF397 domain-containing protein n=2 Tax=Bailinhaonella thermotolerans TaxID=1070861 RepID=A0A3A4AUE7_9ACTN|nr:DUF397 domain-containing protein [Bailinhaonella thermotolerans]RJL33620.1 DUF397 domain-containing protein [Bailinhaonella thermotolerans]
MDVTGEELRTATFRKSSFSGSDGGACVEVAQLADGRRLVRDSKQKGTGPVLAFARQEWDAFLKSVRGGEFG